MKKTVQPKEDFSAGISFGMALPKNDNYTATRLSDKNKSTLSGDKRSRCSVYVGSCGFIFLSHIHPLFSSVTINGSNCESGKVMERVNVREFCMAYWNFDNNTHC